MAHIGVLQPFCRNWHTGTQHSAGTGTQAFCSGGDQTVRGKGGYVGEDNVPRLNVLDLQGKDNVPSLNVLSLQV
eukprot:scaffold287454_cov17-Tisochrysis_lutea.AAC.1